MITVIGKCKNININLIFKTNKIRRKCFGTNLQFCIAYVVLKNPLNY